MICFALLFLLMSAIADLLIPNLQGNILDQVIKVDLNAFHKYVPLSSLPSPLLLPLSYFSLLFVATLSSTSL